MTVLSGMIQQMDAYLEIMKKELHKQNTVFIITGKRGTGKTTAVRQIINKLQKNGYTISGIIQPEYVVNGKRAGFYVQDIHSGKRMILCTRDTSTLQRNPVLFTFNDDAFEFGKAALMHYKVHQSDIVAIDEIGPLELENKGWSDAILSLRSQWAGPMIWVVREKLIDDIVNKWNVEDYTVFDINYTDIDMIIERIKERMEN